MIRMPLRGRTLTQIRTVRSHHKEDSVPHQEIRLTCAAAKAALRRKKVHEKNFEQTQSQITQLEQQIYAIESANINHETLAAMKAAGSAMEKIHGNMTIEKVDETMCVALILVICAANRTRDKLKEQQSLSDEIATAITSNPLGEQPDEEDLENELEGMEQEAMDERMLNTGTVPVADQLNQLPAPANAERKLLLQSAL